MWVNPRHPNPPQQARPPDDAGQRLATLPRDSGREELRVSLDEFNGRPFVSVRVWERNRAGEWWPTKRGVSVRIGEAQAVADALTEVLELTDALDRDVRASACPKEPRSSTRHGDR